MSPNKYDERLKNQRKDKHIGQDVRLQLMLEAERARFDAKTHGNKPKLYFCYGYSEIDIFTNEALTWDLWVKFPFKVPKEKCVEFKEWMQIGFEKIFLS